MKNFKRSAFSKALVYAAITGLVSFGGYAYAEEINAYDNLTSPAAVRKYVNTHRYKKINKPNLVFNKSSLKTTASKGGEITGLAADSNSENVTLNLIQGLNTSKNSKILKQVQNDRIFAKEGKVTGFAAPNSPTLDEMATKAQSFTPSQQYELTKTQGTNTHFLILNGTSQAVRSQQQVQMNQTMYLNKALTITFLTKLTCRRADINGTKQANLLI